MRGTMNWVGPRITPTTAACYPRVPRLTRQFYTVFHKPLPLGRKAVHLDHETGTEYKHTLVFLKHPKGTAASPIQT
jgi:hypothetical protein